MGYMVLCGICISASLLIICSMFAAPLFLELYAKSTAECPLRPHDRSAVYPLVQDM